jgi:PAS domain-containing protein
MVNLDIDMIREKLGLAMKQNYPTEGEQKYYDRLTVLFEKVAWATILWAFIINLLSPLSQEVKNNTFLLIFVASVFNYFYFRYVYFHIRNYTYRFFIPEVVFPFFIWIFVHLHNEFVAFFLLPYYVLILATSLTLQKSDVVIALIASVSFVLLENILLKTPIDSIELQFGIGQVAAILIFTWVALKLAEQVRIERGESGTIRLAAIQEEKKTSVLKEFTSELVLDRQKAQILLDSFPEPLLVADSKRKIMEHNSSFGNLSDFKNNSLLGKDLSFVLKTSDPLHFDQKSFLPQEFEATVLTRRNKEKKVRGKAYFLLGRDQRLKQILILVQPYP